MRKFIDIVEGSEDKDHARAVSVLNQAINGSEVTEQNAEILRQDSEGLVGEAIHFGLWHDDDAKALTRIHSSLAQAIDYPSKRKAETVENIRAMLTRFVTLGVE